MIRIKRFVIIFLISLATLFAGVSAYIYFNQDQVIQLILTELNKHIKTPIEVKKVSMNWWTDFPNVALNFDEVTIEESIEGSTLPLATLKQITISFDLLSMLRQNYSFEKISLHEGEVTLRLTKQGNVNYEIISYEQSDTTASTGTVNFDLKQIDLREVTVNYVDEKRSQSYLLHGYKLDARLKKADSIYHITANGELRSNAIKIDELSYFEGKELSINASIDYNENSKELIFSPSQLIVNQNNFSVKGKYDLDPAYINLQIEGTNTAFGTLVSLLPKRYADEIAIYKTEGVATFNSTIKGSMESGHNPHINCNFSTTNASMFHPEYKSRLEAINLTGSFSNGSQNNLRTSELRLKNISAKLNGRSLEADLQLRDFSNYHLDVKLQGSMASEDITLFYPTDKIKGLTGELLFNIALSGRINDFKQTRTAHRVNTSGELKLNKVGFTAVNYPLPVKNVNATFLFNKNDIAINQMNGEIGNSDVKLNGFFLNIFPYLFQDDQALIVEANLYSKFIDMNELLSGVADDKSAKEQQDNYSISLNPLIHFDLDSKVDQIVFRRFKGRDISGNISVENKTIHAKDLSLKTSGGEIFLNGSMNAFNEKEIKINTNSAYKGLAIDSIFYTFENFDQDFLQDRHLKGKINAQVSTYIVLDEKLRFQSKPFLADINASIINGELNDFTPMQRLSDYIDEEDLSQLRFAEISNNIHIENRTIYLPEMKINSNITQILVQGTHTFDQEIDYRLLVPLEDFRKPDKDEAFGAIEDDGTGFSNLYLKIIGTTSDYEIKWDGKRSLKSFAKRLKQEGKEFSDALKGKNTEKKKEELELSDEYFDW